MRRLIALFVGSLALVSTGFDSGVTTVEPADLVKRADLVGREIETDDHLRFFQFHKGEGYDELYLKRTPVVFRLPPRLRPDPLPRNRVFVVRGILGRDGDRWFCDVTGVEPVADDLERVNRAVAGLTPRDIQTRTSWARWAERRARDFKDEDLAKRARELEAEAIRIESQRAAAGPAQGSIALAERARSRGIPEPEPSALAHQGFRKLAAEAKSVEALIALRAHLEAFFPNAAQPPTEPADVARWESPYANDAAEAYRSAPPEVRKALDHRLWADATERLLRLQAEADPTQALDLADAADSALSDRPSVAARLRESGLKAATASPLKLRQAEVEALAKLYREKLRAPERAQALLRDWLNVRRVQSLRPTDAEGRLNLASQYETLLDDRETAVALLREAEKIDPDSKEVVEAFRLRGYRKGPDGRWVDPRPRETAATAARSETEGLPPAPANQRLRGATEEEVRARLGGRPNKVARTSTQGQAVEQWIYYNATQTLYVNFARTPGDSRPRVVAFYSRRRTALDPPTNP